MPGAWRRQYCRCWPAACQTRRELHGLSLCVALCGGCAACCRPQEEFRFGLLWEWNLYEAMMYRCVEGGRGLLNALCQLLPLPERVPGR